MTRYISLIFYYVHKSFKAYVAEALTLLLRLGAFSWIVTLDKHKNSQFPTLVAAHQAGVLGPQVENRCSNPGKRLYKRHLKGLARQSISENLLRPGEDPKATYYDRRSRMSNDEVRAGNVTFCHTPQVLREAKYEP